MGSFFDHCRNAFQFILAGSVSTLCPWGSNGLVLVTFLLMTFCIVTDDSDQESLLVVNRIEENGWSHLFDWKCKRQEGRSPVALPALVSLSPFANTSERASASPREKAWKTHWNDWPISDLCCCKLQRIYCVHFQVIWYYCLKIRRFRPPPTLPCSNGISDLFPWQPASFQVTDDDSIPWMIINM